MVISVIIVYLSHWCIFHTISTAAPRKLQVAYRDCFSGRPTWWYHFVAIVVACLHEAQFEFHLNRV